MKWHRATEGESEEQLLGTRLSLTVSTCLLGLILFGTSYCTKHLFDAFTIMNQHSLMCYDKVIWKTLLARMSWIIFFFFFSLIFLLTSRQVKKTQQWPERTLAEEFLNLAEVHETL